jgi:hypothetical protein
MSGAILQLSQYAFMAWCSVKKHRDFTMEITGHGSPIRHTENGRITQVVTRRRGTHRKALCDVHDNGLGSGLRLAYSTSEFSVETCKLETASKPRGRTTKIRKAFAGEKV